MEALGEESQPSEQFERAFAVVRRIEQNVCFATAALPANRPPALGKGPTLKHLINTFGKWYEPPLGEPPGWAFARRRKSFWQWAHTKGNGDISEKGARELARKAAEVAIEILLRQEPVASKERSVSKSKSVR